MANGVPAGAAAFQQLQTSGQPVQRALENVTAVAEQRGREKRQEKAAQEKAYQKERTTAFDKLNIADDDFQFKVSGFDSRDDVVRDFAAKSVDQFTKLGDKAREAFDSGDLKSYQKYSNLQQKLKSNFTNFTQGEEALTKIHDNYMKLANEGKISPVDEEYEGLMQAFANNNVEIDVDDEGIVYINALVEGDDGTARKVRVRQSDLVNGNYRPYESLNVVGKGGLVESFLLNQGKSTIDQVTGDYIVTDDVWTDNNERAFQANLKGILADKRKTSYLLYEASGGTIAKKGDPKVYGEKDAFDSDDYKMVEDYLKEQVLGKLETTKEFSTQPRNLRIAEDRLDIAQQNLALRQQDFAKKGEKRTTQGTVSVLRNDAGELSKSSYINPANNEPVETQGFSILSTEGKPIKGIFQDSPDREVLALEYNQPTGEIFALTRLSVKEDKTDRLVTKTDGTVASTTTLGRTTKGTQTEQDFRPLTDLELNLIAQRGGYANSGDLRNALQTQLAQPNEKAQEAPTETKQTEQGESLEDLLGGLDIEI